MKKQLLSTCLMFIALALYAGTAIAADEAAPKTGPAVTVNGKTMTYEEINAQIDAQMGAIKKQLPAEQMEKLAPQLDKMRGQLQQKMIDDFITKTVMAAEADKFKVTVSDAEVDAKIKEFEKRLPGNMTLESALAMSGTTVDKLRQEISFSIRAEKLVDQQVTAPAAPTAEQIKAYYDKNIKRFTVPDKVHARHILVKVAKDADDDTKAAAKAKIETAQKKLKEGGDFAELAKEYSDCPSKEKGGDLGSFAKGRMVKPFETAAFALKPGEVSDIVETRFGYHIIETLDKEQGRVKPLDEVSEQISTTLANKNKNEATKAYLQQLKDKATISYGS